MLENLLNNIVSGIISFSMLLFSSYQGNKAEFEEIATERFSSGLLIKTRLINAFENDFEQVFKSGKRIDIYFHLKIKLSSKKEFVRVFRHSVTFHPMQQYYSVFKEETEKNRQMETFEKVKETVSQFEFSFQNDLNSELQIEISASLPKISIDSSEKEFDLMMLWNFQKPKIKKRIKFKNEV